MKEGTFEDKGSVSGVEQRALTVHVIALELALVGFTTILIEKSSIPRFTTIQVLPFISFSAMRIHLQTIPIGYQVGIHLAVICSSVFKPNGGISTTVCFIFTRIQLENLTIPTQMILHPRPVYEEEEKNID